MPKQSSTLAPGLLLSCGSIVLTFDQVAQVDGLTYRYDNSRSGASSLNETTLY